MKLTFYYLVDFYRRLITPTNSFAKISAQDYPISGLFVLIDRSTCQLTDESFTASSGSYFCFLIIYPLCTFFPEIDIKNA